MHTSPCSDLYQGVSVLITILVTLSMKYSCFSVMYDSMEDISCRLLLLEGQFSSLPCLALFWSGN